MAHSFHLSCCLQKRFSIGIYSINRASEWLWLETQEAPQNGQNVHGFQVTTPICHIVPVSRAYPYMCEIGTMWQIGVLTGKPCTFLVQNGSFSAFWHYKNKERVLMSSDAKWHIPFTCLVACKRGFPLGAPRFPDIGLPQIGV